MSGEPRTTDSMVDALLATHQVPALGEDFAGRVLAAAQSLRAGPRNGSPWPRRILRPWRRSPLWLGFIAINIVAASAVAAMVSGIPVWHHLTEIVKDVTHSWHREPLHSARHRIAPRPPVRLQTPPSAPLIVPSILAERPQAPELPLKTREAIARAPQPKSRSLAFAARSHHLARMAQARLRERIILHRPDTPRELRPHRIRAERLGITARRHAFKQLVRTEPGPVARPPEPQAATFPRETQPVSTRPAQPYGPRLEPQRAFPERQERVRGPFEIRREARAEQRRLRTFGHRPDPSARRPHGRRFNF